MNTHLRILLSVLFIVAPRAVAQTQCDGVIAASPLHPVVTEGPVVAEPSMSPSARTSVMPPWLAYYPSASSGGYSQKLDEMPGSVQFVFSSDTKPGSALWDGSEFSQLYVSADYLRTSVLWSPAPVDLLPTVGTWFLEGDFEGTARFARFSGRELHVCESNCKSIPIETQYFFAKEIHWVRLRWPQLLATTKDNKTGTFQTYLVDLNSQAVQWIRDCSGPVTGDFTSTEVVLGCQGSIIVVDRATYKEEPLFDNRCPHSIDEFPQFVNGYLVWQQYWPAKGKVELVAIRRGDVGAEPYDRVFRVGKHDEALRSIELPNFTAQAFLGESIVSWWVNAQTGAPAGYGVTRW